MPALRDPQTGRMVKNTLANRVKFFLINLLTFKKSK